MPFARCRLRQPAPAPLWHRCASPLELTLDERTSGNPLRAPGDGLVRGLLRGDAAALGADCGYEVGHSPRRPAPRGEPAHSSAGRTDRFLCLRTERGCFARLGGEIPRRPAPPIAALHSAQPLGSRYRSAQEWDLNRRCDFSAVKFWTSWAAEGICNSALAAVRAGVWAFDSRRRSTKHGRPVSASADRPPGSWARRGAHVRPVVMALPGQ
jgi:hypothetical protein